MREILTRLEEFEYITTLIFPENVILYVSFFDSWSVLKNVEAKSVVWVYVL